MPIELTGLKIKRVATVDAGDNPDADIVLFKRKATDDGTEPGTKEKLDKNTKGGEVDVSDKADLGITEEVLKEKVDSAVKEAEDKAAEELKKAQEEKDELEKKLKELEDVEKDKRTEVEKRLDETREELTKMQDDQRTKDAEVAVKKWQNIPGMSVEFAPVLKAVRASAPGQAEKVEEMLDAANAALEGSKLLTSAGEDGEGETDVEKQAEVKAAEFMKADPTLTKTQALAKAWEDPEMYKAYQERGK